MEIPNASVLLVDDQPIIRMIMRDILVDEAFDVVGEARDGSEGYELYKSLAPDIVIMDLNMPIKNGFELLGEIMDTDAEARVVVCSAMNDPDSIRMAIEAGARDYIFKPFTRSHLIDVIRKII